MQCIVRVIIIIYYLTEEILKDSINKRFRLYMLGTLYIVRSANQSRHSHQEYLAYNLMMLNKQ